MLKQDTDLEMTSKLSFCGLITLLKNMFCVYVTGYGSLVLHVQIDADFYDIVLI